MKNNGKEEGEELHSSSPITMSQSNKPNPQMFNVIFDGMKWYVDDNSPDSVLAEYKRNNRYELRNTHDKRFEAFVKEEYCRLTNQDDTSGYSSKLKKYERKALLADNHITVYTRIAGSSDDTSYYMGDDRNTIVYINKDKFASKRLHKDYKFMKKTSMIAQVMPIKSSPEKLYNLLKPYLNMCEDMRILFTVNLVQQFLCGSSHFLSVISAPKGTGKSTMMRWWRKIIDPNKVEVTLMPTTAEELINHLSNHQFVAFDNTAPLSPQLSDILCGAITGVSVVKRQLYTDCAEVIKRLHNTVVLNGIDVIPRRSDLLDRAILFKLDKLKNEDRMNETEIAENFDKDLPYILGSIFNILTEYFKIKDSVTVKGAHRMSQAYNDCYIIATVLGLADEFATAFERNQTELQKGFAESDTLISAIYCYFERTGKNKIEGKASEVYAIIRNNTDEPSFPKSASAFSRQLKQEQDNLSRAGIDFIRDDSHRDYTRIIISRRR